MRILIVGHGVVGKNLEKELKVLDPDVIDKYKPEENRIDLENPELAANNGRYDIAFVCVDTPRTEKTLCDTSEVLNAIRENDAEIYVIKSTVPPGTTKEFAEMEDKRILFSPEYYGGTQHCNNYQFDFTILGGEREDCIDVIQALQRVYDGRHQFRITDSKTAELVKYMENSYLATKVSFCQEFFFIAESLGVDYEELRELFVLDPRIHPSHTFVDRSKPFWDSHCLNKDVPTIAGMKQSCLMKDVVEFNEDTRKVWGLIEKAAGRSRLMEKAFKDNPSRWRSEALEDLKE
jgi:UDPglucose 6-dehydrogenase